MKKLNVLERIVLMGILPANASYANYKIITELKAAEELEIWRAFTWIEQEKIDLINQKNANSNSTN